MMPLLMGLDHVWWQLERLESQQRRAARHAGFAPNDFEDLEARTGRVARVRSALFFSGGEASRMLAARLSGIDLSTVIETLLNACKDVAVYWGGSVLAGGAIGGVAGAFAGGVGAVPGAAVGAGLGTQFGAWVLGILGLKALIEDLGAAVPDMLRHYEAGFRMAWGPVRRWEDAHSIDMDGASRELAQGHVVLMMALLSALLAYLTRGRGDLAARARILQEIRESRRLGPKVADWVAANEEALARHPGLKPKEQQVVMSQARPPAESPMTPSQIRKAMGRGEEDMPPPKKPESPAQPKVMPQKKVRCFEPNGLPSGSFPEFDRQLAGQERGINDMTVDEYVKGREAFDPANRDSKIAKQARAAYQKETIEQTARTLRGQGMAPRAAEAKAAELVADKMKALAALHNPDMIAAGKDVIADFGDRNINSRIGAQWKSQGRVQGLDEAARRVPPVERATMKMNAKLERCP